MKKWLALIAIGLVAAVVVYHTLGAESYVLIHIGATEVQLGLWLVLVGLILFYLVWRALSWFVAGLFGGGWMRKMRLAQMEANRREGLRAMLEGNWSMAKTEFYRLAKRGENPKYNYLLAARASEKMGNSRDADALLVTARRLSDGSDLALDLEQVRMHLQRLEIEPALAELKSLAERYPANMEILSLTMRALVIAQRWVELRQVVIEARANKQLRPAHHKYEKQLYLHLIEQRVIGDEAKLAHLKEIHSDISGALLEDPEIIYALADQYRHAGEHERAESLLRQSISNRWNGQLVRLYGEVYTAKPKKQLQVAEKWLGKHAGDVDLLHALEELARRTDDWEKSRHYAMLARAGSRDEPPPEASKATEEALAAIDAEAEGVESADRESTAPPRLQ